MPAELLRAVEQSCGCAIWSQPESIKEQVRTSCTCRPEHLGDAIVIQRDSRPGRTGEESGPCCRNRCSRWPDTLQSRMVHLSPCPTPEARLTQQRWASNSRKGHWPFPGGGRGGVMVSPGGFRHAQKPLSVCLLLPLPGSQLLPAWAPVRRCPAKRERCEPVEAGRPWFQAGF